MTHSFPTRRSSDLAQAVMIFDSWGGVLSDGLFQEFSLAYTKKVIQGLIRHHDGRAVRSEEHTSELQSLMRISYAVFCLKKITKYNHQSKNMSRIRSHFSYCDNRYNKI